MGPLTRRAVSPRAPPTPTLETRVNATRPPLPPSSSSNSLRRRDAQQHARLRALPVGRARARARVGLLERSDGHRRVLADHGLARLQQVNVQSLVRAARHSALPTLARGRRAARQDLRLAVSASVSGARRARASRLDTYAPMTRCSHNPTTCAFESCKLNFILSFWGDEYLGSLRGRGLAKLPESPSFDRRLPAQASPCRGLHSI